MVPENGKLAERLARRYSGRDATIYVAGAVGAHDVALQHRSRSSPGCVRRGEGLERRAEGKLE